MKKGLYGGIFFISFSILIFELLLIRLLSAVFSPNIAFLGLSLALFGVALGGVIVYFRPQYFSAENFLPRLKQYSIYFAVSLLIYLGFLLVLNGTPQVYALMLIILVIVSCLPLIAANICLALLFTHRGDHIASLYFFDLCGAGLGVVTAVLLMTYVSPPTILLFTTSTALLAAFFLSNVKSQKKLLLTSFFLSLLLFILNSRINILTLPVVNMKIGPAQGIIYSQWNSFSYITVEDQIIPAENVQPAGSEQKTEKVYNIKIDGNANTFAYQAPEGLEGLKFLAHDINSLAFQLIAPPGQSLIIGPGGGRDVVMALFQGHKVVGVEINPIIVQLVTQRFNKAMGDLYSRPDVNLQVAEGRSYLHNKQNQFDTISIPLVDTWASTAGGNLALVESRLYTVEAFGDYLRALRTDGILSVARWRIESVRLVNLFLTASQKNGIVAPEKNFAVLSSSDGVLVSHIFKKTPLKPAELATIKNFAQDNNYRLLYLPGDTRISDYTQLAGAETGPSFIRNYPVNIRAVYDNNPFFFFLVPPDQIFSWSAGSYQVIGGFVKITFLLVLFLALIIVMVPLILRRRSRFIALDLVAVNDLGYFGILGAAFMLVEMSLIQQFVLYLEQPIYSYSVVLAALLLVAGLGSAVSYYLDSKKKRTFFLIGLILISAIVLCALGLPLFINLTIGQALYFKVMWAAAISALPAFFMGMFLPLGLKRMVLSGRQGLIPWAWAINGALSVLGSVLALVLALRFGFTFVFLAGACLYLGACILIVLQPANKNQQKS